MEVGAEQGMWTWSRSQAWMEKKKDWQIPGANEQAESDPAESSPALPANPAALKPATPDRSTARPLTGRPTGPGKAVGPIEIEPVEGGLPELIKKLEQD
jgi:hypothetical protein